MRKIYLVLIGLVVCPLVSYGQDIVAHGIFTTTVKNSDGSSLTVKKSPGLVFLGIGEATWTWTDKPAPRNYDDIAWKRQQEESEHKYKEAAANIVLNNDSRGFCIRGLDEEPKNSDTTLNNIAIFTNRTERYNALIKKIKDQEIQKNSRNQEIALEKEKDVKQQAELNPKEKEIQEENFEQVWNRIRKDIIQEQDK